MIIKPIKSNIKDEASEYFKDAVIFNKVPFTWLAFGSSQTGKSTMVANVFIQDLDGILSWYKPESIYMFAKNGKVDDNFRALAKILNKKYDKWYANNYFDNLDAGWMQQRIDQKHEMFQKDPLKKKQRQYHEMWIIDDCICDSQMRKRFGTVAEIATSARHENIACITLLQDIVGIPPINRRNATFVSAHNMQSDSEKEILYDSWAGNIGKQAMKIIYNQALNHNQDEVGNARGFIFIKTFITDENKGRYWCCLEEPFNFVYEE